MEGDGEGRRPAPGRHRCTRAPREAITSRSRTSSRHWPGGRAGCCTVSSPARFEWTPWYFKELRLIGSNAFGVEEVDGRRQHGIAHYLDLVTQGRVDLGGMLTHTFPLDRSLEAFTTLVTQGETGAVKVAFDFR